MIVSVVQYREIYQVYNNHHNIHELVQTPLTIHRGPCAVRDFSVNYICRCNRHVQVAYEY